MSFGVKSEGRDVRVLVVEDEEHVASLIEKVAALHGIEEVLLAGTVAEARQALGRQGFDLVMIDMGLPDGNGLDLIPLARRTSPGVGIVTMTGYNPVEIEARARAMRVACHLVKPFGVGEIVAVFEHFTGKDGRRQA